MPEQQSSPEDMQSAHWHGIAGLDLAALVTWINAQHGTTFEAGERFAAGEQGAVALSDADGAPYVLKWTPGARDLGQFPEIRTLVDRLRSRGYPAPRYAVVRAHPDGRYVIQTALPGRPVGRVARSQLDQVGALNDLQAGEGRSAAESAGQDGHWSSGIADLTLHGGPGYCLLDSMRGHAPTTARLLDLIQTLAARHRGVATPVDDAVHVDFNPFNILALDQQISGVVDWDGARAGDRAFDLVTLLFYSYEQTAVRDALWQRALPLTDPAAIAIYLAHMIHRQVDWSVRHYDQPTIDRWLGHAGVVLSDIPARTGCAIPAWP